MANQLKFSMLLILILIIVIVIKAFYLIKYNPKNFLKKQKEEYFNLNYLNRISLLAGSLIIISVISLSYLSYKIAQQEFINEKLTDNFKIVNFLVNQENDINLKKIRKLWYSLNYKDKILIIQNSNNKIIYQSSYQVKLNSKNIKNLEFNKYIFTDDYKNEYLVSQKILIRKRMKIYLLEPYKLVLFKLKKTNLPFVISFIFITGIFVPISLISIHIAYIFSQNNLLKTQENLIKSEKELKQSLADKDYLFKEVHHRVKNNLNIIYSLLSLQAQFNKNDGLKKVLNDSKNRIRTMSIIHESLYSSDNFSKINFSEYIKNLIEYLKQAFGSDLNKIAIEPNIEDNISLTMDLAVPCGLIINELVSNSIKHAFPNNKGKISISMKKENGSYLISVKDNGIGLPDNFDVNKSKSLGLKLLNILSKQIKAKLNKVKTVKGTTFELLF